MTYSQTTECMYAQQPLSAVGIVLQLDKGVYVRLVATISSSNCPIARQRCVCQPSSHYQQQELSYSQTKVCMLAQQPLSAVAIVLQLDKGVYVSLVATISSSNCPIARQRCVCQPSSHYQQQQLSYSQTKVCMLAQQPLSAVAIVLQLDKGVYVSLVATISSSNCPIARQRCVCQPSSHYQQQELSYSQTKVCTLAQQQLSAVGIVLQLDKGVYVSLVATISSRNCPIARQRCVRQPSSHYQQQQLSYSQTKVCTLAYSSHYQQQQLSYSQTKVCMLAQQQLSAVGIVLQLDKGVYVSLVATISSYSSRITQIQTTECMLAQQQLSVAIVAELPRSRQRSVCQPSSNYQQQQNYLQLDYGEYQPNEIIAYGLIMKVRLLLLLLLLLCYTCIQLLLCYAVWLLYAIYNASTCYYSLQQLNAIVMLQPIPHLHGTRPQNQSLFSVFFFRLVESLSSSSRRSLPWQQFLDRRDRRSSSCRSREPILVGQKQTSTDIFLQDKTKIIPYSATAEPR